MSALAPVPTGSSSSAIEDGVLGGGGAIKRGVVATLPVLNQPCSFPTTNMTHLSIKGRDVTRMASKPEFRRKVSNTTQACQLLLVNCLYECQFVESVYHVALISTEILRFGLRYCVRLLLNFPNTF